MVVGIRNVYSYLRIWILFDLPIFGKIEFLFLLFVCSLGLMSNS